MILVVPDFGLDRVALIAATIGAAVDSNHSPAAAIFGFRNAVASEVPRADAGIPSRFVLLDCRAAAKSYQDN